MIDRPAWAEVDLAALAFNVRSMKALVGPSSELCAVVKADAYGHGVIPVAREALQAGAGRLAVALVSEGAELRRAGFSSPILLLGPTPPELAQAAVDLELTATVFTLPGAEALSSAALALGKPARVHLKIDTGMNRIGVRPEEAPELARRIARLPGLELEGAYSHFANADEPDLGFAREQLGLFLEACSRIEAAGIPLRIRHMANSAAAIALPEARLDLVRAGIALYGLKPAADMELGGLELRPAMALKARASFVKLVPAGASVSYGRRWFAARPSRIATLPLGYADGYPRPLSGRATVGVRGERAPVAGTVCMDQLLVDVSAFPDFSEGEEAVLFGPGGPSAEELAALLGTIGYEIVCVVGKRLPRAYRNGSL